MGRVLSKTFFKRDTEKVARALLGSFLCRKTGKRVLRGKITEVEVYDGFCDKASHASRGKTARNRVMFGEAGHWYVYFTYGMHWMLNVVTREKGYPAAILVRGVSLAGTARQAALRAARPSLTARRTAPTPFILNGPARVTKFFYIDGKLNGKPATKASGLWIETGGKIKDERIKKSGRIGVAYAGKYWAHRKRRFFISEK